jgi:hypothetical protein
MIQPKTTRTGIANRPICKILPTMMLIAKSTLPLRETAITATPSGLLLTNGIRIVAIKLVETCAIRAASPILWNKKLVQTMIPNADPMRVAVGAHKLNPVDDSDGDGTAGHPSSSVLCSCRGASRKRCL